MFNNHLQPKKKGRHMFSQIQLRFRIWYSYHARTGGSGPAQVIIGIALGTFIGYYNASELSVISCIIYSCLGAIVGCFVFTLDYWLYQLPQDLRVEFACQREINKFLQAVANTEALLARLCPDYELAKQALQHAKDCLKDIPPKNQSIRNWMYKTEHALFAGYMELVFTLSRVNTTMYTKQGLIAPISEEEDRQSVNESFEDKFARFYAVLSERKERLVGNPAY
jgi:hypothetical protein